MKPEVILRVDGSPRVGLGHLVRCIALAHMLKNDFEVIFFCKEIPESLENELATFSFGLVKISDDHEFFRRITKQNIIVLDGYHFDTAYQKQVTASEAKLVCIDDLHDKEFLADLIINHAPGITPQDYIARPYTQFALGLDYALLRPVFLEQAKKERIIEKMETLMICFGGSDHKSLVENTLLASLKFSHFKKIILITGAGYELTSDFTNLAGSTNRIDHRRALNGKQMLDTMLEADLAIVPASGILLEVLAAGCIAISGIYVENQKFIYEHAFNAGLFVEAGNFTQEKLNHAICDVLNVRGNRVKSIDGHSGSRISKLFFHLYNELFTSLRIVESADLDITSDWAANPEIRFFSFSQHQITQEEHAHWFFEKIADKHCHYFIMEFEGKAIGSIRFDIVDGEAIISYLLDPEYHGQGFGLAILKKGIENLLALNSNELTPINIISGQVLKTNIPSIKSFERLGFTRTEEGAHFKFSKCIQ
jgi:UDP-2,4-diacetamido-2,4,6-trideoxy-beta-L-altropyranose hydrolase